jgi:hypothetical protein
MSFITRHGRQTVVAMLDNTWRSASAYYSEDIPVKQDKVYLQATWIHSSSTYCLGRGWYPLKREDFYNYLRCGTADQWLHVAGVTRPLPGAEYVRLWLMNLSGGSVAYFDDALFIELNPPTIDSTTNHLIEHH